MTPRAPRRGKSALVESAADDRGLDATTRFGWPDVMLKRRALEYTGVSAAKLVRAVRAGQLPAGRCGAAMSFRREDLARWMLGPAAAPELKPQKSKPQKSTRRAPSTSAGNDAAIARLRQLAKGGTR